jgi:hypothetical protein
MTESAPVIDWKRTSVPVFRLAEHGGLPELFGSAVVLKVLDEHFLVTAAHVFVAYENEDLRLPGSRCLFKFPDGEFCSTRDPHVHPDPDSEPLDLAVFPLTPAVVSDLNPDYQVVPIDWVSSAPVDPGATYAFVGYPATKFKVDYPRKKSGVAEWHWFYGKSVGGETYDAVKRHPSNHIVTGFIKRGMWKDGLRVIPPDPHGMSGGGVWVNEVEDSDGLPRLVGIGIEVDMAKGCLIGTRIGHALEMIRAIRPELSAHLPPKLENDITFKLVQE